MEHTPKNILIRAVKRESGHGAASAAYEQCAGALGADLTLARLLSSGNSPAEAYRNRKKGGSQ